MTTLFGRFSAKNLSGGEKLVCNIYENPNSPSTNKLFFLNLHKVYNLYILMDFYLVLLSHATKANAIPLRPGRTDPLIAPHGGNVN
jgi:hypothetical protein